ncbi:hypothetical protein M5K25_026318 [Dendrobium thyrsiflorum]|uniref:Uncharacterized protein n=1 Tax=Dendrobium thyrsiflorum TaxID=117978 RepID=A0ABD0TX10_DENTH
MQGRTFRDSQEKKLTSITFPHLHLRKGQEYIRESNSNSGIETEGRAEKKVEVLEWEIGQMKSKISDLQTQVSDLKKDISTTVLSSRIGIYNILIGNKDGCSLATVKVIVVRLRSLDDFPFRSDLTHDKFDLKFSILEEMLKKVLEGQTKKLSSKKGDRQRAHVERREGLGMSAGVLNLKEEGLTLKGRDLIMIEEVLNLKREGLNMIEEMLNLKGEEERAEEEGEGGDSGGGGSSGFPTIVLEENEEKSLRKKKASS